MEKKYWLDDPKNVTLIVRALIVSCALLIVLGLFLIDHGHFAWETWPGFYGIYGFIGCVFLVLVAKEMRKIVMRDEDFYD